MYSSPVRGHFRKLEMTGFLIGEDCNKSCKIGVKGGVGGCFLWVFLLGLDACKELDEFISLVFQEKRPQLLQEVSGKGSKVAAEVLQKEQLNTRLVFLCVMIK